MRHGLKKLTTQNYKNLQLTEGLPLTSLNIFIGPNGSGKSNLTGVLQFLRGSLTIPNDQARGRTGFEDAIFQLGGPNILDGTLDSPANVSFEFEFAPPAGSVCQTLELELLVQNSSRAVMINGEALTRSRKGETDALPAESVKEPYYYYKSHTPISGQGVVSVDHDSPAQTRFEKLKDVPVNQLTLVTIPELLEKSKFPPEKTPIYQIRRQLIETISQWRFYNANDMNLQEIRFSEPKIGPTEPFLAPSGQNLPRVLHNLMQESLDFEDEINLAMKAIFPTTRRIRVVHSGRLSLTIEWHVEGIKKPFYLNEMSDGTVRMLCWATILHAPILPSLLVIDEPEMGIHVAWMRILAEWIKKASLRTQVIICTHSPDLLDHFTDQVEKVSVFELAGRDKTHFVAQSLKIERVAEWLEEGWELGDLYRVGNPSVGGWPW